MVTVPFRTVLFSAAKKHGLTPELDGLDRAISAQLTDGINTAIKLAWEYYDWSLLKRTVSFEVEAHPDDSGTFYLPYADSNGDPRFGTVLELWDRDPRLGRACRVSYQLLHDGVYVPVGTVETIWMEHRPAAPEFNDVTYTARLYLPGEIVYVAADGECYRCISLVSGGDTPEPPAEEWARVEFPKFLAEAVKMGAVAALERGEGQGLSALQLENLMGEWLDHEVDQLATQQRQTKRFSR